MMKPNPTYTRALLSLVFLFVFHSGLTSQVIVSQPVQSRAVSDWFMLMQDPDATVAEVQDAFYSWWGDRTDYKGTGYRVFKRWEYINEFRVLSDGKRQSPGYVFAEHNTSVKGQSVAKSPSGNWTLVGPAAYPINSTSQPTGIGRVNAIAFHPSDPNTIYVGAPSGGIWRTINGGVSWTNLSADLPHLGVSSILIHPSNPDIIFIGTGDRDASDAPGIGVFKSTNGGMSWTQINSSMGNVVVGEMVMHPSNPDIILAATSGGIYKTINGGASWTGKLNPGNFKDIKFKPGDPNTVYATLVLTPARLYRSTNNGETWSQVTTIPTAGIGSRMVIGVTPANPSYVYLVQINSANRTFAGLLRSTDSGQNFTTMSVSPNILGYDCSGNDNASQATYDLCIAVDPTNASTLYVGGINIWKSTNGGASWIINTHWLGGSYGHCAQSVHADHHVMAWSPHNGRLFSGHDGGVSWTANGGSTWNEISAGLEIAQIYKIGQCASNPDLVILGTQDNGTAVTNGTAFTTVIGGDGMECIIDPVNNAYKYGALYYGDIRRSTGAWYYRIAATTNGVTETGAWVTPYHLHVNDPNTMFAGFRNVFRSTNVKASSFSAVSWTPVSTGETATCRVLAQSPANPDIIYVVRSGSMKRTDNANTAAGSVVWTLCALPGGTTPSDVKAHPTNPDIVYATAGYGVYKSTNRGASWTNISANLPALFVNCIVFDRNSNEGLYIGNQTGVWYRDATMTGWVLFSTGLPPVDVRELEIFYDPVGTQHRIKAGTYGRGLWQSDLIDDGNVENPYSFAASAVSPSQIDLSWTLNVADDDVMLAFNTSPVFGTPADSVTYITGSTLAGGGTVLYNGDTTLFSHTALNPNTTYFYKIWSFDSSQQYSTGRTASAGTTCGPVPPPFTETFPGTVMPNCWEQVDHPANGQTWQFGTITAYGSSNPNLTGNYAFLNSDAYGSGNYQDADLISPAINLSGITNVTLTFKHYYRHYTGSAVSLSYSTNNGITWTPLQQWTSSTANPAIFTQTIPALSGQPQVKIKWNFSGGWGYYWAVDDIGITGDAIVLHLAPKVFLQGPFDPAAGMMHDSLRAKSLIPSVEPYSSMPYSSNFTHVGGGGETIPDPAALFAITGPNAIVDWVFIELRNRNNSSSVVRTRSALLQRDGDIVDVDGVSPIAFTGLSDTAFYIAIRHRNHFGVMTAAPVTLQQSPVVVDFRSGSQQEFDFGTTLGNGYDYTGLAQAAVTAGTRAMWAGNVNMQDFIKYQGPFADRQGIVAEILSYTGNTLLLYNYDFCNGYFNSDIDMNGNVKYQGQQTDRTLLLNHILNYPLNTLQEDNFGFFIEQIP